MANTRKRIVARLEQIRQRAAQENVKPRKSTAVTMADLAEEAAALGLELAQLKEKK